MDMVQLERTYLNVGFKVHFPHLATSIKAMTQFGFDGNINHCLQISCETKTENSQETEKSVKSK